MPRPIGYRLPQESKDKIGAANRRAAANRRILSDALKAIVATASAGDTETALRMIETFTQTLYEARAVRQAQSPRQRGAVLAVFDQTMSEINDETAERIRQELTEFVRGAKNMNQDNWSGPAERAAARNAAARRSDANLLRGAQLSGHVPPHIYDASDNDADMPYVGPHQTKHDPMTGTHTHEHNDGVHTELHSHRHEHKGDANHYHHGGREW